MSEPLSILLHAAARGAKLQTKISRKWVAGGFHSLAYREQNRIHPRDRHLRYGPISRVLFEAAKKPPKTFYDFVGAYKEAATEQCFNFCDVHEAQAYLITATEKERSFFLLFVAEALAHEGL